MNSKNLCAAEIFECATQSQLFSACNGQLYLRNNNFYQRISSMEAAVLIRQMFPESLQSRISSQATAEVCRRILELPSAQVKFTSIDTDRYINLKNGVFDTETGTLVKDNKDLLFPYQYDFSFQEHSQLEKAPNFMKFLQTVFPYYMPEKKILFFANLGLFAIRLYKGKIGIFFHWSTKLWKERPPGIIAKCLQKCHHFQLGTG